MKTKLNTKSMQNQVPYWEGFVIVLISVLMLIMVVSWKEDKEGDKIKPQNILMCDTLMTSDVNINFVRFPISNLFDSLNNLTSEGMNFLENFINCIKDEDTSFFLYTINYLDIPDSTLAQMFAAINKVLVGDSINLYENFMIRAEIRINPNTFKWEIPPFPNPSKHFSSSLEIDFDYLEFTHYSAKTFLLSKNFWLESQPVDSFYKYYKY